MKSWMAMRHRNCRGAVDLALELWRTSCGTERMSLWRWSIALAVAVLVSGDLHAQRLAPPPVLSPTPTLAPAPRLAPTAEPARRLRHARMHADSVTRGPVTILRHRHRRAEDILYVPIGPLPMATTTTDPNLASQPVAQPATPAQPGQYTVPNYSVPTYTIPRYP
jgi:hypothetical protein